jgi:hypothetical protein
MSRHASLLRGDRRVRLAAGAALGLVALLLASELLLPPFARSRVAHRLGAQLGPVSELDIGASPSVKLLWGDADRLDVHLGELDAQAIGGGDGRWSRIEDLDARIDEVATPVGGASAVHARKSGDALDVDLLLDPDDRGPGPSDGIGRFAGAVEPQAGPDGELYLALPGKRTGLRVAAEGGALVVRAEDAGPLGGLLDGRRIYAPSMIAFDSVRAEPEGSDVRVALTGRVRD